MLSDKQEQVRNQIKELLSEHFENYVLVVETEIIDPETKEQATFWVGCYQGHSCAVGLLEKQKFEMLK